MIERSPSADPHRRIGIVPPPEPVSVSQFRRFLRFSHALFSLLERRKKSSFTQITGRWRLILGGETARVCLILDKDAFLGMSKRLNSPVTQVIPDFPR